jgi:hypothetical protein
MPGVLVFARNGSKPENATIAAFTFQSGNGAVMLLVAPTRTIIFVEPQRGGRRQSSGGCMGRGKQVRRPVKKWQRGHRSSPFEIVTKPLWHAKPLTPATTVLFRSGTHPAAFRRCEMPARVNRDIFYVDDNRQPRRSLRQSFVSDSLRS